MRNLLTHTFCPSVHPSHLLIKLSPIHTSRPTGNMAITKFLRKNKNIALIDCLWLRQNSQHSKVRGALHLWRLLCVIRSNFPVRNSRRTCLFSCVYDVRALLSRFAVDLLQSDSFSAVKQDSFSHPWHDVTQLGCDIQRVKSIRSVQESTARNESVT